MKDPEELNLEKSGSQSGQSGTVFKNKEMLGDFVRNVLEQFEYFYDELKIEPFADQYYRTHLTARVWADFNKFGLCLFHDFPDDSKTEINIKVLEKDDENFYVYPTQTMNFPYTDYNIKFGVNPYLLVWEDKQIFFKFISDALKITISVPSDNSCSESGSESIVTYKFPK